MLRLECRIQEYDWGDTDWIPDFVDQPERKGRPNAELWMGAHPSAPSNAEGRALDVLISDQPEALLGREVNERFGELPYLFKVLAIGRPLSLQAHPTTAQARAGYDREDQLAIPIDAPHRVYRDPNHKPELICALTPFETLCGFRPVAEARAFLAALDVQAASELDQLLARPAPADQVLGAALGYLLRLEPATAAALVDAVSVALERCRVAPFVNAAAALSRVASQHPRDVGVVIGVLMNHVTMEPGQGLYLRPGLLHAYLGGVGVELMANSDNVVRCGLTSKHVDIEQLVRILDFSPSPAETQTAVGAIHTFHSPVPEFALTRVDLTAGGNLEVAGPAIVLLSEGQLSHGSGAFDVGKGRPVFVRADEPPLLVAGTGLAWVASVG